MEIELLFSYQPATGPRNEKKSAWTETPVQRINFYGSTDLHITQLDDHKPPSIETYPVETNSLKQIRDMLFRIQHLLKQISDTSILTQQRHHSQADDEECRNSWMMVAMVIDRLLLLLFTLLTVIVSAVLLLNHPTYAYNHVDQPLD